MKMKKSPKVMLLMFLLFSIFYQDIHAQQQELMHLKFRVNVTKFLGDNLETADKKKLDMDEAYYLNVGSYFSKTDTGKKHLFLRVPFKDKPIATDFIGVETDSLGNCTRSGIVHINKDKLNRSYGDTFYISNLKRNKTWQIYYTQPKVLSSGKENKPKVLDPAVLYATNNGKDYVISLNIEAIFNPEGLEQMPEGGFFGITPAGNTGGGFGTYSFYFDVNLNRRNFLPPEIDQVDFERP
jgi:hypothetical protein